MIPLYAHADTLHDEVVQADGAFDETIDGLLNLHSFAQPIQLRVVLIEPVLRILPELCAFIGRNLPFVREVALMGCEPTGFARANRDICEVDIRGWEQVLVRAVRLLERARIKPVLMNLPQCAIPQSLWMHAHRSISEWKQVYAPECLGCEVRATCCGLFAWHDRGWRPTAIRSIKQVASL
jgi:His-Xaa-Ser system radical SAM maturase HxsC